MPKILSEAEKAKSRYNNDCSPKGIAQNFMQIKKDASVEKPVSTGNMIADTQIKKIPVIGKYINLYNTDSFGGSNIAHSINAFNESCGNRKKK